MIHLLLDIDGVLVTTPSWKIPEQMEDGFMKFNRQASKNLSHLLSLTLIHLVIVSSHRNHYSAAEWSGIFSRRNIFAASVSVMEIPQSVHTLQTRRSEIETWIATQHQSISYLILDDDSSLQDLPADIKSRWVQISSLKGFDKEALQKAITILGIA